MSKLATVVATAAICLPLGAMLRTSSADTVPPPIIKVLTHSKDSAPIEGHPHLTRAQDLLHEAFDELQASQRKAEPLWSDKTGRAAAIMDAASRAVLSVDHTADWVRTGMLNHGAQFMWVLNPTMPVPMPTPTTRP